MNRCSVCSITIQAIILHLKYCYLTNYRIVVCVVKKQHAYRCVFNCFQTIKSNIMSHRKINLRVYLYYLYYIIHKYIYINKLGVV